MGQIFKQRPTGGGINPTTESGPVSLKKPSAKAALGKLDKAINSAKTQAVTAKKSKAVSRCGCW